MRGERPRAFNSCQISAGSSPHARGTLTSVPANGRNTRFIPACAGNAQSRTGGERESSVHPRMRGERQWMHAAALALDGSSPHARGTHSMDASVDRHHRFIPACAGNAREQCRRGRLRSVHPRMRGERALTIGGAVLAAGSSPHARGTLVVQLVVQVRSRFIPACAGNAARSAGGPVPWAVHPRMRGERTISVQEV